MRARFVCRSYLSQGDAVGATETDMGRFLWRVFVLVRKRPHNALRAASLFSAKITNGVGRAGSVC